LPFIVEERVDGLLQHPLLVADDDLGRIQLLEALQTVVAVDHAPVEIVQITGREAATVERDERAQVRRNHRNHFHDHVLGVVARLAEGLEHLEAFGELLALRLAGGLLHVRAEDLALLLDVEVGQHLPHGLGADAILEGVSPVLLTRLGELFLGEQLPLQQLGLARIDDRIGLEVEHPLEIPKRDLEDVSDPRRQRLQEPDMGNRRSQRDVAHALPAHLGLNHLDATLLTDHATVLHALVLAAVALVVLDRPEDLGAEEPVAFRLEGPVVDRLRLLDFAVRPLPDLVR
jgi:hypothetical protein